MSIDSLKDVLSVTYDAIRLQFDRQHMSWEDDRTRLLRCIQGQIPTSSKQATPDVTANSTKANFDDTSSASLVGGDCRNELHRELLLAKAECVALKQKNDVLKHNFAFLEEKYRHLRMKVAALSQEGEGFGMGAAGVPIPEPAPANGRPLLKRYRSEAAPRSTARASVETGPGSKKNDTGTAEATVRPLPARPGIGVSPGRVLQRASTSIGTGTGGHRSSSSSSSSSSHVPKFQEVVRKKADRAALPGHACEDCRGFYQTILDQGIITEDEMQGCLQDCSRHKSRHAPQNTPPGFWDEERFSMPTPEPQPPLPLPSDRRGELGGGWARR